jgi:rfaE bifunctional protein nucleotidyltransferase chain/domain
VSLITLDEALALRRGRRLVFTNGVFDIVHAGHVSLLERARGLGDLLLVGLNSDLSARRLSKGKGRPVNSLADRAAVVSAIRHVDGVVSFDEPTPKGLVEALRPEVHVKGGDYRAEDLPECGLVRSYGGDVVILPLLEGHSTSNLIARIRAS